MKTIQDIFREIQLQNVFREGGRDHSFSEARRQIALSGVKFNGQQITSMNEEVEAEEGSLFQVGRNIFQREGNKWIRLIQLQNDAEYQMDLLDFESKTGEIRQFRIRKSPGDKLVMIGADGYGECTALDGGGFPIVIEFHEGEFCILVWGDIDKEDPTHVISLEGAREDARKEGLELHYD